MEEIKLARIDLDKVNKDWSLEGYSVSAFRTGLRIPQLNICFDAGIHFKNDPQLILITHSHSDHIRELPYMLPYENNLTTVIVPNQLKYCIQNFVSAMHAATLNIPKFKFWKYNLVGLYCKQSIDIKIKSSNLRIKTWEMTHGFPCLGYGVYQLRKKLKNEYKDLPGKEIGELRKKGIDVTELKEFPIIFFSGDTNKKALPTLPYGEFKYFIIECTFIAEEHLECLKTKEHLHYNNLEPYFKEYQDTTFILIHFSQKYTRKHLDEFKSKNQYKNVVFFY